MKQSVRFLWVAILAAISLFLFRASFNLFEWKGVFLFLAGVVLGVGLTKIYVSNRTLREDLKPGEELEKLKSASAPTVPSDDETHVYIPGRNFEEMLQRLGSDESMLNVILNSMGEGVLLLNQADRIVLMNPSAE